MKRTRFKRDERSDTGQIAGHLRERHCLGVMLPRRLSKAAGNNLSIFHKHATNGGIGKAGRQGFPTLQQGEMHEVFGK